MTDINSFPFSENEAATRLGLSRSALTALREKMRDLEGEAFATVKGRVRWSLSGLEKAAGMALDDAGAAAPPPALEKPASGQPDAATAPQKTRRGIVTRTFMAVPSGRIIEFVLADDAQRIPRRLRVRKKEFFRRGMVVPVEAPADGQGVWLLPWGFRPTRQALVRFHKEAQ